MEEPISSVKENLPVGHDDLHNQKIFRSKMTTSTPRPPLVDLKQIPVENESVKTQTPLATPKRSKQQRKLKRVSLQNGLDKTSSKPTVEAETVNMLPEKMDEIFEEDVEQFVTQVLNQCAQDIQAEDIKTTNFVEEIESEDNICSTDKGADRLADSEDNLLENCTDNNEKSDCRREGSRVFQRHEFVSQFGDVSVNEDYLLDESNYSSCNQSFQDSSKSDEDLLASMVQTPGVVTSRVTNTVSPGPTFLQKVAVMQRVRNATSNLASWVFPTSVTDYHIQDTSASTNKTVKVLHDVACSPFLQSSSDENIPVENTGTSTENVSEEEWIEVSATDNVVVGGSTDNTKTDKNIPCDMVEKGMCTDSCWNTVSSENENPEQISKVHSEVDTQTEMNVTDSSVSCTLMQRATCDFSVQNEVERHSMLCSPIRFESHNKSIQNAVEVHSVNCSPVRFPGCDFGAQNSVDMHSVMCSPIPQQVNDVSIQNGAETCSTMCSPMKIPVQDVSIQNAALSQSVMCSPMVPCPSEDKSVLAGPQLVDNSVMTDVKSFTSVAIETYLEMVSVATEMDENLMLTIGTSMTPLKLDKKQGKKLTADDVRKQHPRVLANEFETLKLEKSRLETQVHGLEKDRKKLVAFEDLQKQFTETKQLLEDLEQKYETEMLSWQQKTDKLETELKSVKSEHESEIMKVREEYTSNDYREHFYSSQKLVHSLQAELDQYNTLIEDIELAGNLQSKMQSSVTNCFSKVQNKAEWIQAKETEVNKKDSLLQEQLLKYTEDMKSLEEDQMSIQNERDQMAQMIAKCKENMLELDSDLKRNQTELQAAEDTVLMMREDNDSVTKDRDVLKSQCEVLTKQNTDLQSEVDKMKEELQQSQLMVQDLEKNLEDVNKRLSETTEKLKKEETTFKEAMDKKRLLICNLERTLENREHEIDSQDKELFECREEIYKQMETVKANEIREKSLNKQLASTERELDQLKDCCATLRGKEQELRSELTGSLEELSYTQKFASDVMRKQGNEITEASSTIDKLVEHMETVLGNLCRRAGIERDSGASASSSNVSLTESGKESNSKQASSLVSQVLSALSTDSESTQQSSSNVENESQNQQMDATNNDTTIPSAFTSSLENDNVGAETPHTVSRKKLGCTANSAFAPIYSNKPNNAVPNPPQKPQVDSADNKSKEILKKRSSGMKTGTRKYFTDKVETKFEGVSNIGEDAGLNSQLGRVSGLFTEITRVAHIIEKALRSSLNDVTFENEDLCSRVSECEYSEKRLKAELEYTQTERNKSLKIIDELNLRIQEMSDKFESMLDESVESKVLLDKLGRMNEKYRGLESERDILNEQIAELLNKMDSGNNGSGVDVESQREVINLKKKVEKYRCIMREKDDQIEQITAKASSRIQKLEVNWKTADAEVCRFDELVDIVRTELASHKLVMEDKDLVTLIQLIDGQISVSAFRKKLKKDLKSAQK